MIFNIQKQSIQYLKTGIQYSKTSVQYLKIDIQYSKTKYSIFSHWDSIFKTTIQYSKPLLNIQNHHPIFKYIIQYSNN